MRARAADGDRALLARDAHRERGARAASRTTTPPLEVVRAAFPAGTLSGAPKVRAMQIIRELEARPRGIYGGAIGYVAKTGDLDFAIAIRTAVCRGRHLLGHGRRGHRRGERSGERGGRDATARRAARCAPSRRRAALPESGSHRTSVRRERERLPRNCATPPSPNRYRCVLDRGVDAGSSMRCVPGFR